MRQAGSARRGGWQQTPCSGSSARDLLLKVCLREKSGRAVPVYAERRRTSAHDRPPPGVDQWVEAASGGPLGRLAAGRSRLQGDGHDVTSISPGCEPERICRKGAQRAAAIVHGHQSLSQLTSNWVVLSIDDA